jgi:dipeptidyl aminopeptidase/acylaminoacyl peptidase
MRGGDRLVLNNPLSKKFPAEQLVVPQPVSFQAADGVKAYGQLFRGKSTTAQPGIIFLHGGPTRQMLLGWHPMEIYSDHYAVNQYLATHGYVVLSVNYRLGIGYGHAFEHPEHAGPFGAAEYGDVLAATRMLQAMPGVDPRRIGIWGSSYGGYLSALALARDSDTFKAGVDIYGISDMSAFVGRDLEPASMRFEDFERMKMMTVAFAASPVAAIPTWRSPVLIVHGDDDRNVPVAQSIDLIERLNTARVPHEEIIIPNEIHSFLLHQSSFQVDQAVVRFFGERLEAAH